MDDVEVHGYDRNCSPELTPADGGVGRGWRRRSGEQEGATPCQKDAQRRNKKKGKRERARDGRGSPDDELLTGGRGGAPGMISGSPVALELGFLGKKKEGAPGFK